MGKIIRKVKVHFGRYETWYDFIDLRDERTFAPYFLIVRDLNLTSDGLASYCP